MIALRNIINIAANALNFKTTFIIFWNYYFQIIIKKLNEMQLSQLLSR